MIILLIVITTFKLRNFFKFKRKKKGFKSKKLIHFNKSNLNNWMNLTKKERYNLSNQESAIYLNKRKHLLNAIRKEYKKISRGRFEENIKEK